MPRREQQRRFTQPDRVAFTPVLESGYAALVLDRLGKQICRIAGVELSCIFVRDRNDPRSIIAAAGYGLPWDVLGGRFGADEGVIGQVMATGEPVLATDFSQMMSPLDAPAAGCTGAAVPVRWNGEVGGVLAAGSCSPDRVLGDEELLILAEDDNI